MPPLLASLLALSVAAAALPLLSDVARTALETAYDGRDHQEEAFAALLDDVSTWPRNVQPGAEPVILNPDVAVLLASPDLHRGRLFRIEGVLHQTTPMEAPFDSASGWFIRLDAGEDVLVYLARAGELDRFATGQRIALFARFYKRVELETRGARLRSFPAFVGAWPERIFPGRVGVGAPASSGVVLICVIAVLLGVFGLLLMYVRRSRRRPRARRMTAPHEREQLDEPPALPDDPADALAALRRHHQTRS